MINFMVVALPRSGTTWAANWLTTDTMHCLHDYMAYQTLSEIDSGYKTNKKLGLSDTGLCMYAEKLNNHPARKVILHRDINEVNQSLNEIHIPSIPDISGTLDKVEGLHVHYTELFTNPEPIWDYLIQTEFDKERHTMLKDLFIQPNFATLAPVSKEAMQRYFAETGV